MIILYRSNYYPKDWFALLPGAGWVRFPAKSNGWAERRAVTPINQQQLHPVPLWLAFNTGLLEAIESSRIDFAAVAA